MAKLLLNCSVYPFTLQPDALPHSRDVAVAPSDASPSSPASCGPVRAWVLVRDGKLAAVRVGGGAPWQQHVEAGACASDASAREQRFMMKHQVREVVDCEGRLLLPGLHDAHIHVEMFGKSLFSVDLVGVASRAQLRARVAAFAQEHAEFAVVRGRGWEQDIMGGEYPSKADLDQVLPDRPCVLFRACMHICVVNSAALRLAGITADTEDPPGGVIDRLDGTGGEPSGILRESAVALLVKALPAESDEDRKRNIRAGLHGCMELGLTAVQTNDAFSWPIYCALVEEEQVPIRVFLTLDHTEVEKPETPKPGTSFGPLLSTHRIKLFTDGSLGAETAALSQPYNSAEAVVPEEQRTPPHDCAKHRGRCGVLIMTQEQLQERCRAATEAGFRIEMHAIGDRAADVGLTSLEGAKVGADMRPILTHCQILRADLIPRMVAIGAIANVQPQFVTTDSRWAEAMLHPSLVEHAYAWKTLMEAGIVVAGGSDAPIEVPNPFWGIHAAVFRPAETQDGKCWRAEESLDVEQAVSLYTTKAAYTAGLEHCLGRLAEGFMADLTIVDCDVIADPRALVTAKPWQVWVDGELRYSKDA